jgi:uncharacterized protein (TIGR02147 family)
MKMPKIFLYTDFRKYLKDVFKELKKNNHGFSHRQFSQKLGLSTSNFIWLVMQGKRNLNQSLCIKMSEIFKHTAKESEYFENMVNFLQAKTHKEKDRYFSRMITLRKNSNVGKIDENQYSYFSNWYNPVIRELVTRKKSIKNDFLALARQIRPQITEMQARKSVELLLELDMIREKGGRFVESTPIITTGPEVSSLAIANFHRAMGHLAVESLDSFTKDKRNITACMVGLSINSFEKVKEELASCRSRILNIAKDEQNPTCVYDVNLQFFPVTTEEKTEESV